MCNMAGITGRRSSAAPRDTGGVVVVAWGVGWGGCAGPLGRTGLHQRHLDSFAELPLFLTQRAKSYVDAEGN
jgi:hypothetical protein